MHTDRGWRSCENRPQKRQRDYQDKLAHEALERLNQEAENDRMEWEEKLSWDAYELRQRNLLRMASTNPGFFVVSR